MQPTRARRALRLPLSLLVLALLSACAEEETPTTRDAILNVPEDYATPQAAAAAARAGDTIVLRYRDSAYAGNLILPTGVSLVGHIDNPLLPRLNGQLTVTGGDSEQRLERLRIANEEGSGLVLQGSACRVEELWIHDCDGPGIELVGDAPAYVVGCDIERCTPGILIRDTSAGGHYDDAEHPAARITDCNFLECGPLESPGDLAVADLVFANIPVLYTVYVEYNHWGAGVTGPSAINETIYDMKDEASLRGLAFTEPEDEGDVFGSWPNPIAHWWQE